MQFGDLMKLLIAFKSNILPTGLYLIQSSSSWLRQPEALQHTISRAHDIRPSGSRTIREFEGVEIRKDANESLMWMVSTLHSRVSDSMTLEVLCGHRRSIPSRPPYVLVAESVLTEEISANATQCHN